MTTSDRHKNPTLFHFNVNACGTKAKNYASSHPLPAKLDSVALYTPNRELFFRDLVVVTSCRGDNTLGMPCGVVSLGSVLLCFYKPFHANLLDTGKTIVFVSCLALLDPATFIPYLASGDQ